MDYCKDTYNKEFIERQLTKYLNSDNNFWKEKLKSIFQLTGILSNMSILDLGCGIGTCALEYAKMGNVTFGVDFTLGAVQAGKDLVRQRGIRNCFFCVGDISRMPIKDNMFDVIIASDIVEHLTPEALNKTLAECKRILRSGGKLFIYTWPTKYYHIFGSKAFLPFILPFFWFPKRFFKKYIEFLFSYPVQFYYKIRKGKALNEIMKQSNHPGLLLKDILKESLLNQNFMVIDIYVKNLYEQIGKINKLIIHIFFNNCEYAKDGLFAICEKI